MLRIARRIRPYRDLCPFGASIERRAPQDNATGAKQNIEIRGRRCEHSAFGQNGFGAEIGEGLEFVDRKVTLGPSASISRSAAPQLRAARLSLNFLPLCQLPPVPQQRFILTLQYHQNRLELDYQATTTVLAMAPKKATTSTKKAATSSHASYQGMSSSRSRDRHACRAYITQA